MSNSVISSIAGLGQAPADLPWDEFECAIVESPAAVEFLDLSLPNMVGTAVCFPCGTAFGANSELRWLTREGGLHFVYISDEGHVLDGAEPIALQPVSQNDPEQIYLWGEKNQGDDDFFETRIPRRLRYPNAAGLSHHQRMAIRLKHYWLNVGIDASVLPPALDVVTQRHVLVFRLVRTQPA
jgi:hypothetical protein